MHLAYVNLEICQQLTKAKYRRLIVHYQGTQSNINANILNWTKTGEMVTKTNDVAPQVNIGADIARRFMFINYPIKIEASMRPCLGTFQFC